MRTRRTVSLGSALVALGLAALCGCSTAPPTSPVDPTPAPAPQTEPTFVRVEAVAVDTAGQPLPVDASVVTVVVNGETGGGLVNGRFQLVVPPGAWSGDAKLTMSVPDPAVLECSLAIDPPEANHFKVPVLIIGHWQSPVGAVSTDGMLFVWKDDMTGQWKPVDGSSSDRSAGMVEAPLSHFSTYGVTQSKAGW